LIIAFSPIEKKSFLIDILQTKPILIEQKGVNLGDKMFHAFEFAFSLDSDAVVMIGTDSPTFPAEFIGTSVYISGNEIRRGFRRNGRRWFLFDWITNFKQKDFENVEWSSPRTFEKTKQNIKNLNLSLREIPVWYDVIRRKI
jgi:glycosyltransferase A (GT-A) superfamily protein (DUF2064 family)